MGILLNLTNFSAAFRSFLSTQGKFIAFTCIFYALWITKNLILGQDFILHSFPGRMIGIATLNGYDVNARVALFYKAIGTLVCCFFIFNLLSYFILKNISWLFGSIEIKIINYVSLTAILFLLMNLLGYAISGTMEMIYFLHKLMLAGLLLRLFLFNKVRLTLYNYTFILVVSLSLNFLTLDFLSSVSKDIYAQFFTTALVIAVLLTTYLSTLLKREGSVKQTKINELMYCLLPLAFLPFVTVLKDEIFLIFKARQLHLASPVTIYVFLLLIVAGGIVLRSKLYKKNKVSLSQQRMIALRYFPVFIFSFIAYSQYRYVVNFPGEMYEGGNRFLPIMEFRLFDVIPTFEKFNSHLLSDYFFCAIYSFFNGKAGYEMVLYDFLYIAISYTLYYFLIFYISRNAFLSLFCVVFFPFCLSMLPEQYSFGVLAFFGLQKVFSKTPTLKKYILFFAALTWAVLWRIDLGYTCFIVMPLLFIYYHFASKNFKINLPLMIKSASIVFGSLLVLLLSFCWYRGTNLFNKIPYALNYISSAEGYGYPTLGMENQPQYKLHYFIFPAIAGIILIALLINFKTLNKSRNQRFAYLALLFTCMYYLVNFNRGLVRHSLIENIDHYISSYIYLLIPGAFLVFFRNQLQTVKYVGFFSIAIFLLINYKVPTIQTAQSFFETATKILKAKKPTNLARLESRLTDTLNVASIDSDIINFINTKMKPEETFIDFSNNPMLYFYTNKISPSYFYQNPLCSHNDFLQDRFVIDLKDYNTPYIVFSRTDNKMMDDVDNVPNTLRHYRIAEHLFQNYEPHLIAGRFNVWKAKTARDNNATDTIYSYSKNSSPAPPVLFLRAEIKFKPGKKYRAKFKMAQPVNMSLKTVFSRDTVSQAPEYLNEHLAFATIDPKEESASFELLNIYDQLIAFQIIEYDYTPDLTFEKFLSYDFSLLPYIWGTFDKKVFQEMILSDKSPGLSGTSPDIQLQKNVPYAFKITENIDRTSGNTVIISCKNNAPSVQKLSLSFGSDNEQNKTKIDFLVIPSNKEENYAVRISSSYRWYSHPVNELSLKTESDALTISKINITKGL